MKCVVSVTAVQLCCVSPITLTSEPWQEGGVQLLLPLQAESIAL